MVTSVEKDQTEKFGALQTMIALCTSWQIYVNLIFLTYAYKSEQQNVCIFQPQPRFLHTAVTTDEYLLVFGGRSVSTTTQDSLIAYSYACNQWIRLLSKGKFALSWFKLQYYAGSTLFCSAKICKSSPLWAVPRDLKPIPIIVL